MDAQTIKEHICKHLPDAEVTVDGGEGKYIAVVVSERFAGLGTVQRHQLVYAAVNHAIADGSLHALSIKAHTPDEAPDKMPDRATGK